MQSTSLSWASTNSGCSQDRFSSRTSLVSLGKKLRASKNAPCCSTTGWIVISPSGNGVVIVILLLDSRQNYTSQRRSQSIGGRPSQGGICCAQTPRHHAHHVEREIRRIAD